jgi:protein-tyrosine phosphatase
MAMIHLAIADGIKEVAITHHILSNMDFDKQNEIISKFEELKQIIDGQNLDIKIHLGCEIYSQVNMELFHTISTYNDNKKYFLVEFPMQGIPRFAPEKFFDVITQGFTPIIAHPERNAGVVRRPERAYELVQRGALLQMNAGSIVGRHGSQIRDTAEILLNSNLIHFVGSDGHNTRRRPIKLSDAREIIVDGWGAERAELLFVTNPGKAIAGEPIDPPEPLPPQSLKKGLVRRLKELFK